jgi:hypothetical protein
MYVSSLMVSSYLTRRTNHVSTPLPALLDLIRSNARALYGRHLTYDVITTAPKRPVDRLTPTKYDGQKVHALLIGYDGASSKGRLLRGAYTVGTGRTPPTVEYAVKLLYDEMGMDVEGFVGKERGGVREGGMGWMLIKV